MRTFSIWRHALFALSLLTLSSTAFAGKPHGQPAKPDHPTPSHQTVGKHGKHKTATVPKAKSTKLSDRVRSTKSHAAKTVAPQPKDKDATKDPKSSAEKKHDPAPKAAKSKTPAKHHGRTAKRAEPQAVRPHAKPAPKTCLHDPVTIVRGADNHSENLVLTRCNGRPADGALQHFSTLVAPNLAAAPSNADASNHAKGAKSSRHPTIKSLDVGLMNRIQAIATHFPGKSVRIASSYRPLSARSYHQTGRAVDLVLPGVRNEELVAFCRTLPDTGCGYYPNSSFVHVDVRAPGTGHVYWIDASKPGEAARYVTTWPEKSDASDKAANPPPGVHDDDHPVEEASSEPTEPQPVKLEPPAAAPIRLLPPGDVELDSKRDDKKSR
ncbi:MAG: DUF882 domain-containing protein [Deltaproteobacteria bacterium]|nr:DUF882 domain-containing protein [Deltaproteobacteria bacterium]